MNQLYDKLEAALRQSLRIAQTANAWHGDASADAAVLFAFVLGRWQLFAKSGFKRLPAGRLGVAAQVPVRLKHRRACCHAARSATRGFASAAARAPGVRLYAACTVDGASMQPAIRQPPSGCFSIVYSATSTVLSGRRGAAAESLFRRSPRLRETRCSARRSARRTRCAPSRGSCPRCRTAPDARRRVRERLLAVAGLQRRELVRDDGLDRAPLGAREASASAARRRRVRRPRTARTPACAQREERGRERSGQCRAHARVIAVPRTPDMRIARNADLAPAASSARRAAAGGRRAASPTPAISFSASAACVAPTMPTSGANTPIVAQRVSSSSSPSPNRQW